MAVKNKTYSLHHVVILLAIAWPMLYAILKYQSRENEEDLTYNKPNLVGIVISNEKPVFSKASWFDGSYQSTSDDYNNDHWAYKERMVRLNNQFYYKAFNQIRVNGFVLGKNDYAFSEGYIFSAFGDDLIKEEKVKTLLQKAKVVQDTLKKKGIDLLLVYAPGKGQACKEFVEDKYVHPILNTNHNLFVTNSKNMGVNYLDLYSYFDKLKPTSKYPLFPKFGHHWSYYGECLAVDTIIKHIEKLHSCDMPAIIWNKVDVVDSARSRDADVLKSMNLYNEPNQNMKLAYPEIQFENDSSKNTTRVLTISDSYWYGPVYMGVGQACFANGQFWYYANRVVPSPRQGEKVEVWELNLKQEIESNHVIMILYSDGNLPMFGNNFIEDAYELYTSPKTYYARAEKNKQIQVYAKQVRETPALLKKSTQKSNDLQIPLDSAIKLDAMNFLSPKK
ncbi:MAG: hypothetical protein Q8T03_10505 [Bacteroidota bacterium]|nr:hypothetical protein [Bacteroidota bacterium]